MSERYIEPFIARKNHTIFHNRIVLEFVKGSEYKKIEKRWLNTLLAEKVLIKKGE